VSAGGDAPNAPNPPSAPGAAHAPGSAAELAVEVALEAVQVDGAAGVGVVRGGERADGLAGRRVLIGAVDPCGACDVCRRGGAAVCPLIHRRGLLGESPVATAAARWLVPLGDGLDLPLPAAAAVAGDVALAYTLYARTGVAPRDTVVVVGESPISRFLIEILVGKGIAPAALATGGAWADWLGKRRIAAGADRAALRAALDDRDQAQRDQGQRPWRVICVDPRAVATAAALAGPRATLTVFAGAGQIPAIPGDALSRELTVVGVAAPHPDLVVEAAAMCARRDVDLVGGTSLAPDPLRTHVRVA
jgi:threonine dehydrogenase-like Zn-dependent dehydrogenase